MSLPSARRATAAVLTALIAALIAALAVPVAAAAATYTFDPDHTEVRATWDHLGLSRQSGIVRKVEGNLEFDPAAPQASRVSVRMAVRDLATGVAALDRHLVETGDYFDAAAHPDITFVSTEVAPTSPTTANVTGNLTINGITKPVVLVVTLNFHGEHPLAGINPNYQGQTVAGFSGRAQILRSEWGLTRTIPLVSDEIRILIEAEVLQAR
ncbi:MAG: YceI family protein [Hyphomicrobiaceae bacterium]|nr:YceI family protein [Hyphomicrobiaceae bacterium]